MRNGLSEKFRDRAKICPREVCSPGFPHRGRSEVSIVFTGGLVYDRVGSPNLGASTEAHLGEISFLTLATPQTWISPTTSFGMDERGKITLSTGYALSPSKSVH